MCKPRSIYVIIFLFYFSFSASFNCQRLFFVHFLEYLLSFLDDNVDEKSE